MTITRARLVTGWLAVSALAVAVAAPLPYLLGSLPELARQGSDFARTFAGLAPWRQAGFYLHIVGGGVALGLSPVQLSPGVRRRAPRLHRVNGRVVATAILLSGAGAFAVVPGNQAGMIGVFGFGGLAAAWAGCATLTVVTARRRDLVAHRRWAVRTFSLTYAAVTLRLWLGVLVAAGLPFDTAYLAVPFLSWLPNLAAAEWYLRPRGGSSSSGRGRPGPGNH